MPVICVTVYTKWASLCKKRSQKITKTLHLKSLTVIFFSYILFWREEQTTYFGKIPLGILVLIEFSEGKLFSEYKVRGHTSRNRCFFIRQFELICIAQLTYNNKGHIIGLYVELVTFFSSPLTFSYVAAATSQLASNFFSHAFGAWRVWMLDSSTRCCSRNDCVKTGCVSQSVVLCFIYSSLDDKRLAFILMYVYSFLFDIFLEDIK